MKQVQCPALLQPFSCTKPFATAHGRALCDDSYIATNQNNQDGSRIANNTLDLHVFTVEPTTVIHWRSCSTAAILCWYQSGRGSAYVTWYVSLTGCMSIQSRPQAVSSASVGISSGNLKSNPEESASFFVSKRKRTRLADQVTGRSPWVRNYSHVNISPDSSNRDNVRNVAVEPSREA